MRHFLEHTDFGRYFNRKLLLTIGAWQTQHLTTGIPIIYLKGVEKANTIHHIKILLCSNPNIL